MRREGGSSRQLPPPEASAASREDGLGHLHKASSNSQTADAWRRSVHGQQRGRSSKGTPSPYEHQEDGTKPAAPAPGTPHAGSWTRAQLLARGTR